MPDTDDTIPRKEPNVQASDAESVLSDASLNAIEAETSEAEDTKVVENTTIVSGERNPESLAQSAPQESAPVPVPQKAGNGRLIALIVGIVVALVVVIGGGFAAYAWHTNPEHVVFDSVTKLAQAQAIAVHGTVNSTSTLTAKGKKDSDIVFKSTFDTKADRDKGMATTTSNSISYEGKDTTVKVAVVAPLKDGFYVKADGVYDAYKSMIADALTKSGIEALNEGETNMSASEKQMAQQFMQAMYEELFAKPLQKIDGQWIKVSDEDITSLDENASDDEISCSQKAFKALIDDKKTIDEARALYQKHAFMSIKSTGQSKDGSNAYDVKLDETRVKDFMQAVTELPKVKAVKDCSKEADAGESKSANKKDDVKTTTKLTIWAQPWTHTLTGIDVETASKADGMRVIMNTRASIKTGDSVTIERPTTAKPLKDVVGDLGAGFKDMMPSSFSAAG